MTDGVIRSAILPVPHAFLDAARSDARRFDLAAPDARPVFARQVHSARALAVDGALGEPLPEVDALATATPGLALGIVTADCAPVLLADSAAGVIGAAHAGWRGAHGGVLEAVVEEMERLGAQRGRIAAAIGPCVAQASYEVDEAFRAHFSHEDERFFAPGRPGHQHFDLEAYVAARLAGAGVNRIEALGIDTYANSSTLYSYRRATHRGEARDGRQFSLIALPG